ncbi:AAA family ATPase [Phormidesmis priestleyi]
MNQINTWFVLDYEQWGFGTKGNRGLGISALFAGASRTGKTMGAEVLAETLRLDLYRIDLSSVVSKYIGETEKNLRRIFDAAESGAVIFGVAEWVNDLLRDWDLPEFEVVQ